MRSQDWAPNRSYTGHIVGTSESTAWDGQPATKRRTIEIDDLVVHLRLLVRKGLPATRHNAGEVLPYLRNVAARAAEPTLDRSCIAAITPMMEDVVAEMQGERYGRAAEILFGVDQASRGLTLTVRRERAAEALGYDVHHFRKRVEPKVIDAVAEAVFDDLGRYARRRPMRMDAFQAFRPKVIVDRLELDEESEVLSMIWQQVYALRVLRIREHRLKGQEARKAAIEGDQVELVLDELCERYASEYGSSYLNDGELRYALDGLSSLIVWRLT